MIQKNGHPDKLKAAGLPAFLLMILLPPLVIIPIINRTVPDPKTSREWIWAATKLRDYTTAKMYMARLIQNRPLQARYHLQYVSFHFQIPQEKRDDPSLLNEYENWIRQSDPNRSDIGYLALAQAYLKLGRPAEAMDLLGQIRRRHMRYLNTLRGQAFMQMGEPKAAQEAFETELANRGDRPGAAVELARLYIKTDQQAAMETLAADKTLRPFIPAGIIRRLALRTGRPVLYVTSMFRPLIEAGNAVGFAGAFLVLTVWVYFLHRLDPFEPEKSRWILTALGLGALTPFPAMLLYDLLETFGGLTMGQSAGRDLLYCIVGIGLIEESVKLIPVFFMIRFTKEVNESVDYIVYASLGALGFSFVENLLYFNDASLFVIKERGMICSVGHMFYTSLILYGLVLARYGKRGTAGGNLRLCFVLACTFHGIYDFFLLSNLIWPGAQFISIALAMLMAVLYVRILNNTLNQSEYFDPAKAGNFVRLRQAMGAALVVIVMFEYVGTALRYGPTLTYERFVHVIVFTWFLVLFFASTLGTYTIRAGYWLPWWKKTAM
jgi:RsiW-degrading membrane proteinase PrsW (M82 family)